MKMSRSWIVSWAVAGVLVLAALTGCGGPSTGSEGILEAQTTGSLSALGSMAVARSLHTATLLLSGEVLIAGGAAPNDPTRSVELFDPRSGRSRPAADMHVARYSHTAALLPNGKVLVVGGFGPGATSAELYDPASDTFSVTGPLSTPHSDAHAAVRLENGEVLILGGDPSGTGATPTAAAELYDPVTDSFRPTEGMTIPRRPYGVVRLHDGRVLVAGGTTTGKQVVASAELYDPLTGHFSRTGDLLAARQKHAAAVMPDGSVLVMGGSAGNGDSIVLNSSEVFDPVLGSFRSAPSLSFGRYKTSAVSLPDGSAFVAGGSAELVELFDVRVGRFSLAAGGRQGARFFPTATLLADGSVLIAGGYGDHGSDPTVWRYAR